MIRNCLAVALLASVIGFGTALAEEPRTAGDAAKTAPPCVRPYRIRGWSTLDETAVVLTAHARKYKVTFVGPCRYTNWSYGASVRSSGFCLRPGDTIFFHDPGFPNKETWCMVSSVSELPRDWKAPPKARKPQ